MKKVFYFVENCVFYVQNICISEILCLFVVKHNYIQLFRKGTFDIFENSKLLVML